MPATGLSSLLVAHYFPSHSDSGGYRASVELKMDISSWVHFINLDTFWMEIILLRTVTLDSQKTKVNELNKPFLK